MCPVLFGWLKKSTRRSGRLVKIAHFQSRPLTKNGRDALEMGCLHYPLKADIGQPALPIALPLSVVVAPSLMTYTCYQKCIVSMKKS
jgi:hypothetical protein